MQQQTNEAQPATTVEATDSQPTEQAAERPSSWTPPQEPTGCVLVAEGEYVRQDGHFPAYGTELDPSYLPQETPRMGRSPWRPRDALRTDLRTEDDEVFTTRMQPARVGDMVVRLMCRHMFHHNVGVRPSAEDLRHFIIDA